MSSDSMSTSRSRYQQVTPERSTELVLYFVYQNTGNDDDVSMFVWAHDPDEAQRLWFSTATLLNWNVHNGASHVRPVPTERPNIASAVEWEKLVDYYIFNRSEDGKRIIIDTLNVSTDTVKNRPVTPGFLLSKNYP